MLNEYDIVEVLLNLAKKASKIDEIPVSAILVKDNRIIAKAFNKKNKYYDVTAHAEVLVIKKASKKLKRWNLSDCTLYVSLKPCQMCIEIIKQSHIENVYYLLEKPTYKHEFSKTIFKLINSYSQSNEYKQLLSSFFKNKR